MNGLFVEQFFFYPQHQIIDLREKFERYFGFDSYKKLWKDEVLSERDIPTLTEIVRNWDKVRIAFKARNILVHGRDRYTRKMAEPHIEALLKGAGYVYSYCDDLDKPLNGRMPIRRRKFVIT